MGGNVAAKPRCLEAAGLLGRELAGGCNLGGAEMAADLLERELARGCDLGGAEIVGDRRRRHLRRAKRMWRQG